MKNRVQIKKLSLIVAIAIPITVGFQNCSQDTRFSSSSQEKPSNSLLNATDEAPGNIAEDPEAPSSDNIDSEPLVTTDEGDPLSSDEEKPDEVISDETNGNDQVSFAECRAFIEIQPNSEGVLELPTRMESSKTCYFRQILHEIPNHKSGSLGEVRSAEVLSSNHNGNYDDYIGPFVLGDAKIKFDNLPGWKIALSGAYDDPQKQIAIDNFYLVDFQYGRNPDRVKVASAFGTKDAEPGEGVMPILYKDLPLEFTAYANGGTAWVDAIELTPGQDVADSYMGIYDLRVQALDCGGTARGTDVFVVFH